MNLLPKFENYLINRRDVLSRLAKTISHQTLINTALHSCFHLLADDGESLTLVAKRIGQALQPDATDKAQVKLGGRFINFLHINKLVELTQLTTDIWMVTTSNEEFKSYCRANAAKKRVANITTRPKSWHRPFNRGVPIVKKLKSEDQSNYTIDKMPEVYKALNILQETQWTINVDILKAMIEDQMPEFMPYQVSDEEVEKARSSLIKHKRDSLSLEEWIYNQNKDETKYARKNARSISKDKFKTNSEDVRNIVKDYTIMTSFVKSVELANDVAYQDLYFQHNLDSRGRIYALSTYLSPQGPDYQKALLKFASPGPVKEHWLKVHIANCAGKDKLSFDARSQWVYNNEKGILAVGTDCTSDEAKKFIKINGIEAESKSRWQFLAACIEYKKWKETGEWTLPIGIDATSSGLQFLSAVARDDSIAEDVNISNCTYAPVGDIYQRIGNAMVPNIDKDKAPATAHLKVGDKTVRKLVKRSTMTFPYSCQGGSMGDHTFEDRYKYDDDKLAEMKFSEASYLGHLQYDTIKSELPRSAGVMKAMQDCFTGYSGCPDVSWTSPVGFKAVQYKPIMKRDRVRLEFDKRKDIQVVLYTPTDKPSINDHKMAISPNVVHCLDAAMMVKTICNQADNGITQFYAVHDQFGGYSGDIDILGDNARRAFYDIIKNDPVQEIMNEALRNYNSPEKGSWNPEDVLKSKYFLC